MRRSTSRVAAVALAAAALLASACSGGGDITQAGKSDATTLAPGETAEPTTTVAVDDLPDCPTDALDSATDTVDLTFWTGMSGPLAQQLQALADEYNSSQSKVKVTLVEDTYEGTINKYRTADQSSRPDIVQMPEYMVQEMIDTDSVVPVGKCITASGFDTSAFLPSALSAYASQGMQWSMPFNLSNPVLFYNKKIFAAAGLDPEKPPTSLEELQQYSQQIVDSGAAKYGIALESGYDSGGGWYIEQWFCKAQEFYVDGDNGRTARATKVLYNNQTGNDLLTYLQNLITTGLAVNVGDNSNTSYDDLLQMADATNPAAMAIHTSAAIGGALDLLRGGTFPNLSADDVGIGPMPGPDGKPGALIGGASLYPVNGSNPVKIAAAWDFITFLVGAQQQSQWAAATGYIPVRSDATEVEPYKTTLSTDPRFAVAYEQLAASPEGLTSAGPVVGPLREMRSVLATAVAKIFDGADVAATLTDAETQANNLIASYNERNGG